MDAKGKTVKSSPKKSDHTRSPAPKSSGTGLFVLSLIFRLLLLGVGSGFAWALGVGAAQIYPSATTEMPLSQKLLRQFQDLTSGAKPLQTPSPILPSPIATPSSSQLSPTQKQKVQADLRQLQGELNALIGRTAALETQLGSSRPTETLEKRLEVMSQELGAPASAAEPSPALPAVGKDSSPIPGAKANSGEQSSAGKSSVFSGEALMVTLPSDVLFDPGSSALRAGTNVILDNLIADLQNYEDEIMKIHDAAMPRMSDINRLSVQLKALKVKAGEGKTPIVLEGLDDALQSLDDADHAMSDWMKNFSEVKSSLNEEGLKPFYEKELEKITVIRNMMINSIDKANSWIAAHPVG